MNIQRPVLTENYTVLSNDLLNYGRCIGGGLKPRDSAVLNYLLSRPPHWKLRAKDISRATNISINTVYAALSKLRQLGFASFTRDKTGHTFWIISLHETLSSPVYTPRTNFPRQDFCDDLINNKSLISNEKTTTGCVSSENKQPVVDIINTTTSTTIVEKAQEIRDEVELPIELVSHLSEVEQVIAKKAIRKSKIDSSTYNLVLLALKAALLTGNVRSPLAYFHSLINKAKDGSLHNNTNSSNKAPITREQAIKDLVAKYGDKMLFDIVYRGFISNETLGYVTYLELKDMGLISHYWSKKYDDYQRDKLNQLAMSCSNTPISTRSDKKEITKSKQRLSESEFESKRSEQIARALELANQLNS